MTILERFKENLKGEYDQFIDETKKKDFNDIIHNSEQIAWYKYIYTYLTEYEPLSDEEMEHLCKITNPIEVIGERSQVKNSEIHERIYSIVGEIVSNDIYCCYCRKDTEDLLQLMQYEIEDIKENGIGAESYNDTFAKFSKIAPGLEKYVIEQLQQTWQPLKLIMDTSTDTEDMKSVVNNAVVYLLTNDIYTIPYELNKTKLTPESKYRHNLIQKFNELAPNVEPPMLNKWISYLREWNKYMLRDGENPYQELNEAVEKISSTYGKEMAATVFNINMDEYGYASPNEIVQVAAYLNDGGDRSKIADLLEERFFEQPYITKAEQEQGGIDLC